MEKILVAVIIDISEGDSVTLLKMSETTGEGDIVESATEVVAEHDVGHHGLVPRLAGAEIDVQPAVVVEVAEVRAHRQHR